VPKSRFAKKRLLILLIPSHFAKSDWWPRLRTNLELGTKTLGTLVSENYYSGGETHSRDCSGGSGPDRKRTVKPCTLSPISETPLPLPNHHCSTSFASTERGEKVYAGSIPGLTTERVFKGTTVVSRCLAMCSGRL